MNKIYGTMIDHVYKHQYKHDIYSF